MRYVISISDSRGDPRDPVTCDTVEQAVDMLAGMSMNDGLPGAAPVQVQVYTRDRDSGGWRDQPIVDWEPFTPELIEAWSQHGLDAIGLDLHTALEQGLLYVERWGHDPSVTIEAQLTS